MSKQSSVEWFFEVLALNDIIDHNRLSDDENLYNLLYRLKKQAKAMHEQEHRDTWIQSEYQQRDEYECSKKGILSFEDYYNQTFKTK